MPRTSRVLSSTGIYHCILRGIDKQDIFLEDMDRYKFINEIIKTKEKYKYELYAYCLMDNHVHLMIKDTNNSIHKIMQSLTISYSEYFNKKYDRTGHLFQNRFLSKPVENERYALTLQRYIHQNPPNMWYYKWSSYNEYIRTSKITDVDYILNMLSNNNQDAIKEFIKFNNIKDKKIEAKQYIDYEICDSISDSEAIELIKNVLSIDNVLEIKKYNTKIRNYYINQILDIKGIKGRQVARILQFNKNIIRRIEMERCVPNGHKCAQTETSPMGTKEVQDG